MEKIAIIGMGSSGMAVLAAYAKEVDKETIQIDCYDSEESFGRGYPYREDSHDLILNLKTRKISYDYQNNDDLANWIEEKGKMEPIYTPRAIFGEYTKDRLSGSMNKIGAQKITEKIVRMDKVGKQWELETQKGSIHRYDRVHLCNGEVPQRSIYNKVETHPNFIQDIYPVQEKLAHIKDKDRVCVIGAGLTAVDVVTHLITEKNIRYVAMFSRTNVIPTVRVEPVMLDIKVLTMEVLNKILEENYSRITFEQFDELFNKELQSHDIDFERFTQKHMKGGIEELEINIQKPDELARVQALLPIMNVIFNKVWDSLSKSDRIKFRKKYHPFMTLNRSPLPLESAEILINAHKKGILVMPTQVEDIVHYSGEFHLKTFKESKDEFGGFDYIINATGLDTSMEKVEEKNELLAQLIDKRYVMVDEYGGFTVVPETMASISSRYGTIENLHIHGVLASGVQYRNNSTLIIQMTAHRLIKELYC